MRQSGVSEKRKGVGYIGEKKYEEREGGKVGERKCLHYLKQGKKFRVRKIRLQRLYHSYEKERRREDLITEASGGAGVNNVMGIE